MTRPALGLVLALGLGFVGCSTDSGNGADKPMPMGPMGECDQSMGPMACSHASPRCGKAAATCGGTPTTIGACVCKEPALGKVGPTQQLATIDAGAFGADAFYWAESGDIVKAPIGEAGQVLISGVGLVSSFRVTADTIYVYGDPLRAFSLKGEPLPAPDPDVAFPPETPRVTYSQIGWFFDGKFVGGSPSTFAEVEDGAYYVGSDQKNVVYFLPFSNPKDPTAVLAMPVTADGSASIRQVWASGGDLYLSTLSPDQVTSVMYHVDLTIVGK